MKLAAKFIALMMFFLASDVQSQLVINNTITTNPVSGSSFCPGSTIKVSFSIVGVYNANNVFRVQLSSSSGLFPSSPTVIGSLTSNSAGTITATIPSNAQTGGFYRVRVVSTSPAITGSQSGNFFQVASSGLCGTSWSMSGNANAKSGNVIGFFNDYDRLNIRLSGSNGGFINKSNSSSAWGLGALTNLEASTGVYNEAFGSGALNLCTSGSYNSAFGSDALYRNSIGNENVALGYRSLTVNQSGSGNLAAGCYALYNSLGDSNTAIGSRALYNNRSGSFNTALGFNAMSNNQAGIGITGIGYNSNVSSAALDNATVIGYNAIVNANNKVRIGNTSVTIVEGPAYSTSDGRFKTNIQENAPGLDFLMKLKPVTYNFQYNKFSEFLKENSTDKDFLAKRESVSELGFIAQDIETTCKELGIEVSNLVHTPETDQDNYAVAYQNLVVPLVKGIQEQQKIIQKHEETIDAYKTTLEELQKKFETLESKINNLNSNNGIPPSGNSSTVLSIMPNPSSGNATLLIPNNSENVLIKIYDEKNMLVWQTNSTSASVNLPAKKFSAGIYTVLVEKNQSILTTRMVVAR